MVSPAATPDGGAVYQEHCASCHDTAAGRVPSREAMKELTPRRIVNSLESGIMFMPGRRMTPAERVAVAEFLTAKQFAVEPVRSSAGTCAERGPLNANSPQWSGWSPDPGNSRFQPTGGISASDLPRLRLNWAFGFEGDVMAFAQPSIYGGRVFTGSAGGTVYALDSASGCIVWRFEADAAVRTAIVIAKEGNARTAARRAAARTTLWFGDLHSNVYAVDAASGVLRWKKKLDPHSSARITAAPALHNGKLYVPVSSFEEGMASMPGYECCTFRGSVVALDATTGTRLWQRFMVNRIARPMAKNSAGAQQYGPSGVAVWSSPTVDAKRGLLYVTTGDNYSDPSTGLSDSVLALRLGTGTIAWSQQLTANDRWNAACLGDKVNCPIDSGPDHDFGAPAILTKTTTGRELIVAAQKSGTLYALDPAAAGKIIWKTSVGKGGPLGGIQWGHTIDRDKVYAPISDVSLTDMSGTGGGIAALTLDTGALAWKAPPAVCGDRSPCSPAQMAAATAIPGAVFSGARDGIMRAFSSEDGRVLWSYDTFRDFGTVNGVTARGGSIDGPGPVIAGGMLLFTSGYSLWNGRGGNVLLSFTLSGETSGPLPTQ